MKLLIRTITLAAIGLFMTLIILHSTIVETVRQQMEVSAINSIYHTVDTYEKNAQLLMAGESDYLYFLTNDDYFNYFYDDVLVQLNGNVKVDMVCNYINVETGDLDVDITVFYKGLDGIKREYTVHADTYGRIKEEYTIKAWREGVINEISEIPAGSLIEFSGHHWMLIENNENNLVLLLNEDFGEYTYGSSVNYANSNIKTTIENFAFALNESQLANYELHNMNTLNGAYFEDGSDVLNLKAFALSSEQAARAKSLGYVGEYWTSTASGKNKVYVMSGSLVSTNINASFAVRPAICVLKNSLTNLTDTGSSYQIS